MSSAPLLGEVRAGKDVGGDQLLPCWSPWVARMVDTEEAMAQLQFGVPMVLTNMAYYGIPLASFMFSGNLGDIHLAGATLGNSWATVTGYAFVSQCALLFLRQDPDVSHAAAVFVQAQIPGLFAFSFLHCLLRYLQAQSVVLPLVVCSVAPFALHVALTHLLVNVLGLGLAGAAAAVSATFWVLLLDAARLRSYLQGVHRYMDTRVSNEIGAGNVEKAKNAVSVTMKLSVFLAVSFVLLLAFGHNLWASLFSRSTTIVSEFVAIAPLMMISIVLDSAQGVLSGVSRGCGWQHMGAMTNLGASYLVGMPPLAILAFKLKFYTKVVVLPTMSGSLINLVIAGDFFVVQGLWAGLICGLTCQACSLLVITVRTKWSELAEAMQEEKTTYVA
ncbi:unnamed protein product [Urochloa decumbens]|uniref:Protein DETOXIFICATION n=1 Tax=Urochloa decumbens TaxID=240449 RepID=A0ABC9AUD5_9POAL